VVPRDGNDEQLADRPSRPDVAVRELEPNVISEPMDMSDDEEVASGGLDEIDPDRRCRDGAGVTAGSGLVGCVNSVSRADLADLQGDRV
jgi:hypothetical protein